MICCCVAKSSELHVWVSEKKQHFSFSFYTTTLPWYYPPRFCSGEHAVGVGMEWWYCGEREDYSLV